MSDTDERDADGNLTSWALAHTWLVGLTCTCIPDEWTCLRCTIRAALRAERARVEKAERERDAARAEVAQACVEAARNFADATVVECGYGYAEGARAALRAVEAVAREYGEEVT